jgi:two-component system, NtrC family, sensor kinase
MTRTAKVDNESQERAVSSVPISRKSVVSVAQISDATEVDPAWLDRLLIAATDMPVERGESAVVEFLVRALGDIFPALGIGACLVSPPQSTSSPQLQQKESGPGQQVFRYLPAGEEQRAEGMDPTRVFPGYAYERILEVEATGTTLHVASDDPAVEEDDSPLMHVVRRAGHAMARGLSYARAHAKASANSRDLRALSSHMVQAEKLASLGQIAAGVVHELNNPLTSIVAYTDWLTRKLGATGDPDSLERLRRIGESSGRILRFTRDLVAYARPSSEVPVPVSLHNVIEQALAFCEHVLAEHNAKVERRFAESLPPVRGMPEQLVQVFVNLFTNACHAMPADGGQLVVTSRISADGRRFVIEVEDNGHGIDPEHLTSIFTPFFTTKVDGRGTGLGLSIVKNIIDNHGAEIRAERGGDGGARFLMLFPAAGT